jgi:hypothetical protein
MQCETRQHDIDTKPRQVYHYVESGLDNVYLKNVDVRVCETCNPASPRLPRILELHSTIARAVAMQPCPLRGQDIRFLRKTARLQCEAMGHLPSHRCLDTLPLGKRPARDRRLIRYIGPFALLPPKRRTLRHLKPRPRRRSRSGSRGKSGIPSRALRQSGQLPRLFASNFTRREALS